MLSSTELRDARTYEQQQRQCSVDAQSAEPPGDDSGSLDVDVRDGHEHDASPAVDGGWRWRWREQFAGQPRVTVPTGRHFHAERVPVQAGSSYDVKPNTGKLYIIFYKVHQRTPHFDVEWIF